MAGVVNAALSRREFIALTAAGFAGFFGLWALVAASGLVPALFLPTPAAVAAKFVELTQQPFVGYTLQHHLASSFGRFAMGFALAVVIGIPLGLAMGWFRWLDGIVSPLFDALRFVAPIAWVPFAALWFGTGIGGPVLVIFAGAFPPCVINAYRGARYVDRRLVEAAQTLGASNWLILTEVLLPASVPSLVAGVRVSAGLGLAISDRRRADRRLERHRLPDRQGSEQHQHRDRDVGDDRDRDRRLRHRRRPQAARGVDPRGRGRS